MGFLDSFKKMFSSQDQEDRVSLSRKVQASPNDPQARQKLGIFLMQQGEVVEGLDQLARCRRPLREGRVCQQGDRGSAPDAEARSREQRLPEMADPASGAGGALLGCAGGAPEGGFRSGEVHLRRPAARIFPADGGVSEEEPPAAALHVRHPPGPEETARGGERTGKSGPADDVERDVRRVLRALARRRVTRPATTWPSSSRAVSCGLRSGCRRRGFRSSTGSPRPSAAQRRPRARGDRAGGPRRHPRRMGCRRRRGVLLHGSGQEARRAGAAAGRSAAAPGAPRAPAGGSRGRSRPPRRRPPRGGTSRRRASFGALSAGCRRRSMKRSGTRTSRPGTTSGSPIRRWGCSTRP